MQEKYIQQLQALFPEVQVETSGQWPVFQVSAEAWNQHAAQLKQDAILQLDYLFCLTCIDWKTHLTVVYHLSSTFHRETVVVKVNLARERPVINTVSALWRTAEFHEREAFEMFGVEFAHHPDLRLLILPDGWEGKFPLRKDFEDPVNMIKL